MNRNVSTRVLATAARPARPTALRPAPRFQPKKKSIVGRIVRWTVFLGIVGTVVATFFVKASDDKTYADLYTVPACKWAYNWVHDKISPPEEPEVEVSRKDPGPSELDLKFDEAVAQRGKAESAKTPEAADEAVAFLEKELDASGKRIDVVREVGVAASKSAPRKTRVGTERAVEELAAQAAFQKKTAATLTTRKSEVDVKAAIAAIPPPPPPPAPPPPPPATVYYDLKKFHAWPAQPVGTWVRWKKTAGETVSTEDHLLATLTDEAAVVRIETATVPSERVFVFGADRARVLREETVKVGEAEIPCRVVQSGSTLRWIPKEGPGADRVALKTQVADLTVVVTELGEEEIPVKGEAKKCLKMVTGDVTVWGHDDVPGFVVRVKTATETVEAVEWGTDPSTRPVTKKPSEDRPEKAALAEAERLRVEGWVLLQEVMEAMKDRPGSQDTLKSLYYKLETASAMLTRSRDFFLAAKIKASDPASLDETVSILGRLLGIAERHMESIKPRLKVETTSAEK